MASDANHELCIERLHQRYLIPFGATAPTQAGNVSEAPVVRRLAEALENVLRHTFVPGDNSLWFISQLAVEFPLNPQLQESRLAEICAMEIAAELLDVLQRRDAGVVRFADEAEYCSHFLLDLAEGSAWGKWYYSEFDGLRSLPVSAAIRTILCDAPEAGGSALYLLSESQCARVVRALTAPDAERVLAALAGSAQPDESRCFAAICDAWPAGLAFPAEDDKRRALLLFLACCRSDPSLASERLSAAATALAKLARYLCEQPRAGEGIFSALRNYHLAALIACVGVEASQGIAPCLRCAPGDLENLLRRIAGEPMVDSETRRETRFTAFGGAFLLLPLLDEFPFEAAVAGWPECEETHPAALVRFLVLAKCLGTPRARGCLQDSLLRDFLGIPPQIDSAEISEWLGGLIAAHLETLFCEAANWHLEFGVVSAETFVLARVAEAGVTILLDALRGVWLFAETCEPGVEMAQAIFDRLPQPRRVVGDEFCQPFCSSFFPRRESASLAKLETPSGFRLNNLAPDLEYLALPRDICPPAVDSALSVVAQSVMRRFAWKLPGFALSSLEYLHSNFLDCCAAVEQENGQQTICVGRPPLHLVLGIAGLNRCSYRLSWLGDRDCSIFPEG